MSKLERIRQKLTVKGVPCHPCVELAAVRAFESRYGLALPQDLIDLYCGVCNGCTMLDGFSLKPLEAWEVEQADLQRPFPFARDWIWEDEEEDEEKISQTLWGNIELIDVGDAQSWHVIVNGAQAGQMWLFTDVGIQPCAPPKTVLEWFEFWLDGKDDYFAAYEYPTL